ncbi:MULTISPECIES: hypothetical protein [Nocardia]|uniref:hypothetical protein n=1 Tax=Nocardia TaxID=1817 RepID=UPI0024556D00|nr:MULTISPECIES: hypothetical protein [Nocardia]
MTTEEWADAIASALNSKCMHVELWLQKAREADECDRWKFEWACDKVKAQRDSLIAKARAFGDPVVMARALDRHMLASLLDQAA